MYTKPWVARDKLRFSLMPAGTDLMEMIPSASEAAEYRRIMVAPEVGGMPTRTQQLGLLMLLAALIVYVFVRVGW